MRPTVKPIVVRTNRKFTTDIPLGGNAYITTPGVGGNALITASGLENWTLLDTVCSVFVHFSVPGEFSLALRLRIPPGSGGELSRIAVTVGGTQTQQLLIEGTSDQILTVGKFINPSLGYLRIDLQGVSRTGPYFAEIYEALIFGNSGRVTYVPDDFYFGRRGPSVHLRYDFTTGEPNPPLEYFYNEVMVPQGQDVIGAYFAAIGFSEGYFGIQVNSAIERRILFSIWSAYDTDDPEQIPEEYRVILLRKGPEVIVQDFGDEGSGKQSILKFDWVSGVKYKFIAYGIPLDVENSIFTAWFQDPTELPTPTWQLIASFQKPKRSTNMKNVYSFSENFIPEQGWIERKAFFENPWTRDSLGNWREITSCTFTGDATSRNGRLDVASGVEGGEFFLRNCGFLNDPVEKDQVLVRGTKNNVPDVNVGELP